MEGIIAERLITSTYYKIHLIKSQISTILLNTFPSSNPKKLATIIKKICDFLEKYLLSLQEDRRSDPSENIRITKFIANFLGDLASHLRFMEGASTERTPWNLILPFESFVKEFYPSDSFLIVRPQWHYNYKMISNLVEAYKSHLEKGLSKKIEDPSFSKKLYIVSFPGFEKSNVLLHANLGHEIGHPFASDFLDQEDAAVGEEKRIADEVEKEITKTFKDITELEKYVKMSDYFNRIFLIRKRGLEEIISDYTSVKLFGIASIFAIEEIADIAQSVDEVKAPQYYPPLRMRMRLMYETLLEDGLNSIFSTQVEEDFGKYILGALKIKFDEIKNWVSIKIDEENINNDPQLRIAYNSINAAMPQIKGFIKTKLKEKTFTLEKVHKIILPLCDRLAHRIPPNAVEEPFNPIIGDIPTILNAGWFYKIACLSKLSAYKMQEEYNKELNIINDLLLKAIELSYIHHEYSDWKEASK